MERLREIFVGLGLRGVETFITSGNVVFDSNVGDLAALEARLERALETALGYPVGVFVRDMNELAAILRHEPFEDSGESAPPSVIHVAFLRTAPGPAVRRKVAASGTEIDDLAIKGRELYWRVRGRFSDSRIGRTGFGPDVGVTTVRNRNTIARLVKKYGRPQ